MKDIHEKDDTVPGGDTTLKQETLCAGSALIGKFDPIRQICNHVIGFHFYSGEMKRQVIAHHYCSMLSKDFYQCVVYDSDKSDAKLIGVEYIISEEIFKTLPEEERKFWHSHVYEVKSGILSCTRLPYTAENALMEELIHTYGKTYHFWQVDRGDKLPLGPPTLMMAFTEEGQLDPALVKKRDEICGIDTDENRKQREYIKPPLILPGADHWTKGKATILDTREMDMNLNMNRKI